MNYFYEFYANAIRTARIVLNLYISNDLEQFTQRKREKNFKLNL